MFFVQKQTGNLLDITGMEIRIEKDVKELAALVAYSWDSEKNKHFLGVCEMTVARDALKDLFLRLRNPDWNGWSFENAVKRVTERTEAKA